MSNENPLESASETRPEDIGTETEPARPAGADGATDAAGATNAADATDSSRLVGEDLAIGYPTTEEPVVEIDRLDLPAGEVTALVGPNGSGKSTLLKALARQHAPEDGVVLLDGDDVDSFDTKAFARRVGLLSQEHESPGSMSVEELIYYGRYPHRGFFDAVDADDEAAVERAIELAGVDHLCDEEVGNLSGGQKQLVWIAMVLAQETDVLLLDEPTTYLDLHHQLRVLDVVTTLNEERGVTVGLVLHDISQAARFADYLVAMHDGELYDWGPPREIVTEQLLADVFNVEATVEYEPEVQIHPKRALLGK